jgi:hypothetical protein
MRTKSTSLACIAPLLLALLLSSCTPQIQETPEPTASVAPPEPSQSPQIIFIPGGTAKANLPVFEKVLEETGAGAPGHDLTATINSLVVTGFSLESITHTSTISGVGQPADSVSLAIAFDNQCLIGQFSTSWLVTEVSAPTLSGCLIGDFEQASLTAP